MSLEVLYEILETIYIYSWQEKNILHAKNNTCSTSFHVWRLWRQTEQKRDKCIMCLMLVLSKTVSVYTTGANDVSVWHASRIPLHGNPYAKKHSILLEKWGWIVLKLENFSFRFHKVIYILNKRLNVKDYKVIKKLKVVNQVKSLIIKLFRVTEKSERVEKPPEKN